jgi:hypothetical protein
MRYSLIASFEMCFFILVAVESGTSMNKDGGDISRVSTVSS